MTAPNRAAMKIGVFLTDFSLCDEMNFVIAVSQRKERALLSAHAAGEPRQPLIFGNTNCDRQFSSHVTSWQVGCQTSAERYKPVNRTFPSKEGLQASNE
jgi:hypothetical protein